MKADETVMSEEQLKRLLNDDIIVGQQAKRSLEAQAEVSFKAGIREGYRRDADQILNLIKEELEGLTVIGDEELQKFAIGYIDYPKDKDGEYDMSHPKFIKGHLNKEWRDITQAQLSHTIKELKAKLRDE